MCSKVLRAWGACLAAGAAACAAEGSDEEPVGSAAQEVPACMTVRRGASGAVLDTYVNSTSPEVSDGAALNLYTGRASGSDKRALLHFDLVEIPAGHGVLSATLSLYQSYKKTSSVVRVHRALLPWTEADATWGGAGSAFAPEVGATIAADGGYGDRAADVRDLVQGWVDGAENHGFLLEEDPALQTAFRSSETTLVSQRPALSVCHDAPTCNDGVRDQGEEGVDCGGPCAACVYTSCKALHQARSDLGNGIYPIDPDGAGPGGPYNVHCNMALDGGGWQLISVRWSYSGALFDNAICTSTAQNCSGTIPAAQRMAGSAPHLLFATTDGIHWLHMAGLRPPGSSALFDVITLQRLLTTSNLCTGTHYCNTTLDPSLQVHSTSPNFTARFTVLSSQYSRLGGIWFGNGGGSTGNHVVSLNYPPSCGLGGLDLSSAANSALGNVRCGAAGALYFRY